MQRSYTPEHRTACQSSSHPLPTANTTIGFVTGSGISARRDGAAALRHCGTATLRHCGTAALRHCGTAALRHCGTAALRHCAIMRPIDSALSTVISRRQTRQVLQTEFHVALRELTFDRAPPELVSKPGDLGQQRPQLALHAYQPCDLALLAIVEP